MTYLYFALAYLFGIPLTIVLVRGLVALAVKQIRSKKRNKRRSDVEKKPSLWSKVKPSLQVTAKDKRDLTVGKKTLPVKRLIPFYILYFIGLIFAVLGAVKIVFFGVAIVIFFLTLLYGWYSGRDLVQKRERAIKRMVEIAQSTLGVGRDASNDVVSVLEWRELIYPQKIRFTVPTSFSEDGQAAFLRLFNQVFGSVSTFVAADEVNEETGEVTPGWNYEEGFVTIRAVPPLPRLAPWDAHYIEDPGIAWSFFPLALGVEGGVELPNPETGEVEHVLGFDLSGLQAKVGSKAGHRVGPEIVTSPMVLIAGGTGGGKALSDETLIRVRRHHAD